MVVFRSNDFNISNSKQSANMRVNLEDLAKSLIIYAKSSSKNQCWDYYITKSSDNSAQWGAICPTVIQGGFENSITQVPNIYFNIPQSGGNAWINTEIQFKHQIEIFNSCYTRSIPKLLTTIQTASHAKIKVFERVVLEVDKRNYSWNYNTPWDNSLMPEIDVTQCTPQYMNHIFNAMQQTNPCKRPGWVKEPVFVIKYELQPNIIISSTNVEKLFGDKVRLLAPIIDYFIM